MTVNPEKIYFIKMALLGRCDRRLSVEHSGPWSDPVSERKNDRSGRVQQKKAPATHQVCQPRKRKEERKGTLEVAQTLRELAALQFGS